MAEEILSIFISPPIAFARLGSSSVPQDAYSWVRSSDPRSDGETTIEPSWSLRVSRDGPIEAFKPTEISFVDNSGNVRPVAPFFEFWARVGEPGGATREVPLTKALLTRHNAELADLKVTVDAQNLKAARRTRNPKLGFGTYPPVTITAGAHDPTALLGSSPPSATTPMVTPMVPRDRNIRLGSVQMTQSMSQPGDVPESEVNLATIRLRLTPAKGSFLRSPVDDRHGCWPRARFPLQRCRLGQCRNRSKPIARATLEHLCGFRECRWPIAGHRRRHVRGAVRGNTQPWGRDPISDSTCHCVRRTTRLRTGPAAFPFRCR